MGLFSDACTALIDAKTGKALTGAALEVARQDPKWPRCDNRVSKKARCCGKCGWPAPGGWWKCPQCGKWVGNESNFCWNCNQPLRPDERVDMAGGVWRKAAGRFAERFEVADVKKLLAEGLQVQEGTAAILLDAGAEKSVLGPGRHNPDGLLRKINWFGNPPPRSMVLVDNGDVLLPIHLEDLRSAEEIPLEFIAEVTLHFVPKRADDFLANLMKENRELTYEQLTRVLLAEIRYAVDGICNRSTVEDLVKDPARRNHVEDTLAATLKLALERFGLELVRVGAADFGGDEYDELRQKAGAIELQRRDLEFDQRLRELLSSDQMGQFKTAHEVEQYVAQLAQEKQVSGHKRKHELDRLLQVQRHELTQDEASYQMAAEMEKAGHEIGIKLKWDDFTRDKLLKDADVQDKLARQQTNRETTGAMDWLKVRSEKERVKNEAMRDRGDALKGRSAIEMAALIDDPEQRKAVLELARLGEQKNMTPEQILATLAAGSPAAAQALGQMSAQQKDETRKLLDEMKQLFGQSRERDERMLTRVVEMMSEAAKHTPGGAQQIFK
ncbi:MAG: SPFH domain-containing protein [Kiritimatiellia bacterium]